MSALRHRWDFMLIFTRCAFSQLQANGKVSAMVTYEREIVTKEFSLYLNLLERRNRYLNYFLALLDLEWMLDGRTVINS